MQRPEFITHLSDAPREASHIRSTGELLGLLAPLTAGLQNLRVEHEILPPGRRSASPHAHTAREEFIFVLDGMPDLWIDGHLSPLRPGDAVSFAASTGIAHTLINNTDRDVVLLTVATMPADDACFYPFNPTAGGMPEPIADDWRQRPRGPHPATATPGSSDPR